MKRLSYLILIGIAISSIQSKLYAQKKPLQPPWQIGAFGGIAQYYGDISNKPWSSKFSGETKYSFGALGRYHFNPKVGLGLQLQHGAFYSAKPFKSDGTTNFDLQYDATFTHANLHAFLNLTNFFFGEKERMIELYSTFGVGHIWWVGTLSKISNNTTVRSNAITAPIGYKTSSFTVPATLGLALRLAPNLKLSLDGTIMTALTDEVDFYRDGYQYDILSYFHAGLNYFIGGSQTKTKKQGAPKTVGKWEPEIPIKVIDYEIYKDPPQRLIAAPELKLPTPEARVTQTPSADYEFRVQVYAKTSPIAIGSKVYRSVKFDYPIVENTFNGLYRYSTGTFRAYSEAEAYARTMQSRGVHDAFVVAYRNNQRIPITEDMKNKR